VERLGRPVRAVSIEAAITEDGVTADLVTYFDGVKMKTRYNHEFRFDGEAEMFLEALEEAFRGPKLPKTILPDHQIERGVE
jgi:hypothetical protein